MLPSFLQFMIDFYGILLCFSLDFTIINVATIL